MHSLTPRTINAELPQNIFRATKQAAPGDLPLLLAHSKYFKLPLCSEFTHSNQSPHLLLNKEKNVLPSLNLFFLNH